MLIAVCAAAAVGLMVLARRFAPRGGWFADSSPSSAVFGVVGSGFAVLLAFVIFIAYQSYNTAKQTAAVEAVAVRQLFRTAVLFSPPDRDALQGDLICYGRAVVQDEWRTMRSGAESPVVTEWLDRFEVTIQRMEVAGPKQQVAYGHWFDQAAVRREGRRGRLTEATPFVPTIVWVVLILAGTVLISFVCSYADPSESVVVQSLMMVGIVTMVVSGLLLVRFLDLPYEDTSGSVRPIAMTQSLGEMEPARQGFTAATVPCDDGGTPLPLVRPAT